MKPDIHVPSRADGPVLEALRAGTGQAHRRLEQATGLMSPTLSHTDYAQALARLLQVVAPLEAALPGAVPPGLQAFVASRRKAALLRADLAYCEAVRNATVGVEVDRAAGGPFEAIQLPRLAGTAAAFGALYVLEGSMLGGAVIAPHVERRLGVSPGACTRYFRAYGDGVGRMWREWREVLAREVAADERDEATAAAVGVFEAFGAAFAVSDARLAG